ncbi:Uncharacterized protein Fot_28562 [Forsythia ovata]|uniref:Uncharacterized protein n=1 Tax=Forsythia ovata TaxID=205694 RepID=A0ABD1TPC0_9LAMI
MPMWYNHSTKIAGARMPRRCNPHGKIVGAGRIQVVNHGHLKVQEHPNGDQILSKVKRLRFNGQIRGSEVKRLKSGDHPSASSLFRHQPSDLAARFFDSEVKALKFGVHSSGGVFCPKWNRSGERRMCSNALARRFLGR